MRHETLESGQRGVAIVTGGRAGIGRATALALARVGFEIALLDLIDDDEAHQSLELIRVITPSVRFYRCDIGDTESHAATIDEIVRHHGRVDCLVNNAGIMQRRCDVLELRPEEFDQVMRVNLRGAFFFCQAVIGALQHSSSPNRCIINITSANAHMVSPSKAAYCISKAGLSMASSIYAVALAPFGISVFEVRPGFIRTGMNESVRAQITQMIEDGVALTKRWGEPEDVAETVSSLATGAIRFSTGSVVYVSGGIQVPRL